MLPPRAAIMLGRTARLIRSTGHVDGKYPCPLLRRNIENRAIAIVGCCRIDQNVNRFELRNRRSGCIPRLSLAAHVAVLRYRLVTDAPAVFSAAARSISRQATLAPALAKARQMARPMPPPAPVTIAV